MEESQASISDKKETIAGGLYLYCIAEGEKEVNFGKIGVEEEEVYTTSCDGLLAVVHDCQPEPYKSENEELVKKWVMAHQKMVDTAWERFGTVLPFGFDTIIRSEGNISSEESLKNWLKKDCQNLKEKLEKVRDKEEYGVQISWDPKIIAGQIIQTVPELKKLDEEIKTKSAGTAFMYEEKLKKLIREEMEKKADECFKDFYGRIRPKVNDIKIDKTKKAGEGKQMFANLSCLVNKDKVKELGEVLDEIEGTEAFFVRFTGPWPPYSFA